MRRRHRAKPFRQGQLDALCGPYSIVNAVHYLLGPLPRPAAGALLSDILHHIAPKNCSLVDLKSGTSTRQIHRALRDVVLTRYPIKRKLVARTRKEVNGAGFFTKLSHFFDSTGGVVLTGFDGIETHWTVLCGVKQHSIVIFDSCSMRYIRKASCTTNRAKSGYRYVLYPTCSYYLWRDDS